MVVRVVLSMVVGFGLVVVGGGGGLDLVVRVGWGVIPN